MSVDPVQKLNRELGDWALIFLMVTLYIGPLSKILKRKNLIALRRMLGLLTYFYVVLHLTSYIIIDLQLDWHEFVKDVTKRNFIILGMTSVVLLTPLALTSNNISLKILGPKSWKKLHYLVYPCSNNCYYPFLHDDLRRLSQANNICQFIIRPFNIPHMDHRDKKTPR